MAQHSQYRQVRCTVTEERGGFVTVTIYAKPVRDEWRGQHLVSKERFRMSDPPATLQAALTLLGQAALAHADAMGPRD